MILTFYTSFTIIRIKEIPQHIVAENEKYTIDGEQKLNVALGYAVQAIWNK